MVDYRTKTKVIIDKCQYYTYFEITEYVNEKWLKVFDEQNKEYKVPLSIFDTCTLHTDKFRTVKR